jgi:hypothetical protein
VEELLAEMKATGIDEIKLGFVIAKLATGQAAGSRTPFPRKSLVRLEPLQARYGAIPSSR